MSRKLQENSDSIVAQDLPQGISERLLDLEPDPVLVGEGWERRFVADLRRAEETGELYRELGFEVRLEPVRFEDLPEGCEECQLAALLQFKTVYTRKQSLQPR